MKSFNTVIKTAFVFGASFLLFAACGKKDDGGGGSPAVTPNVCTGATSNYYNNNYCVNGQPVVINGQSKQLTFTTLSGYANGMLLVTMAGNGQLNGTNGMGVYDNSQPALYRFSGPVSVGGTINFSQNTCTSMATPAVGSFNVVGQASANAGTFTSLNITAGPYQIVGRAIVYDGETRVNIEGSILVNGVFCGQISTN